MTLEILLHILDVLIVAFIAYKILIIFRGTRAMQLLKGLLVLVALTGLAYWRREDMPILHWTLNNVWTMAFVAIPLIFQPELRSMLEKLGRGHPFGAFWHNQEQGRAVIAEITEAVKELAAAKTGALIAIERSTGLKEYSETGVKIDGLVTKPLLVQIFHPRTPLHDGAVIIKDQRIVAASCYFPLSDNEQLAQNLGSRHRAGVGLTEQSDALVVIVSEETGTISVAEDGKITRYLDIEGLTYLLEAKLIPESKLPRRLRDKKNKNRQD
ncbi:MAG: TIGR00159 family protein [Peptococcaceae bacterium]|nr:TIGR00159 family protein [Peptococcaceae bacterium]